MAFMGRGETPLANNSNGARDNNDIDRNNYNDGYWYYRKVYYVPLDNTYVAMQIIVTLIILAIGLIAFMATYESSIIDPIENMKKLFINIHLIMISVLLVVTLVINFFSKDAMVLIKRLAIIVVISIISMLVFSGIKLNMDITYNKNKFEQFYTEQNTGESSNVKSKVDISLTGFGIKTEKEYYLDECMKLYNIFKAKTYGTLAMHLILNALLIYQILKLYRNEQKKERINKDDSIIFDDEENVKI